MRTLLEYINKSDKDINPNGSIDYSAFSDLFIYIRTNETFLNRIQLICDKYRKEYSENISERIIIDSVIFKKLIDDAIESYNELRSEKVDINLGTRRHLNNEIASFMLTKIKLDQDPIKDRMGEE